MSFETSNSLNGSVSSSCKLKRSNSLRLEQGKAKNQLMAKEAIFETLNHYSEDEDDQEDLLIQVSYIAGLKNFEIGRNTKYTQLGATSLQKIHLRNQELIDYHKKANKGRVWSTDGSIEVDGNGYVVKRNNFNPKPINTQQIEESFGSSHLSSSEDKQECLMMESCGSSHLSEPEEIICQMVESCGSSHLSESC